MTASVYSEILNRTFLWIAFKLWSRIILASCQFALVSYTHLIPRHTLWLNTRPEGTDHSSDIYRSNLTTHRLGVGGWVA